MSKPVNRFVEFTPWVEDVNCFFCLPKKQKSYIQITRFASDMF